MKRILSILLLLCLVVSLCACSSNTQSEGATQIKFSQTIEELRSLDGKQIKINGFMSLLSPLNGELIYLMNIPFQSCPYCIPNTNTLSNTIAVVGKNIEFTQRPVQITGTLVFGEFFDDYGYEYSYRIENAEIAVLDEKEISEKMRVYYTLSDEDYISDVYVALMNLDQVIYHKEYGLPPETFDESGAIPFERYKEICDTVNSLNANGEYNDFLTLLNGTKTLLDNVNTELANRNYEAYPTFKEDVDKLYEQFSEFITKYEF